MRKAVWKRNAKNTRSCTCTDFQTKNPDQACLKLSCNDPDLPCTFVPQHKIQEFGRTWDTYHRGCTCLHLLLQTKSQRERLGTTVSCSIRLMLWDEGQGGGRVEELRWKIEATRRDELWAISATLDSNCILSFWKHWTHSAQEIWLRMKMKFSGGSDHKFFGIRTQKFECRKNAAHICRK